MLKSISCTECRKQHRKCDRASDSQACVRCDRMHLTCRMPNDDEAEHPEDDVVDGTKQMRRMKATVDVMENSIHQLQMEIDQLRMQQCMDPPCDASSVACFMSPASSSSSSVSCMSSSSAASSCGHSVIYDDYTHTTTPPPPSLVASSSSFASSTLTSPPSTIVPPLGNMQLATRSTTNAGGMLLEPGHEWKVRFVNGQWQIETGIRTLTELAQLQNMLYRHISPFQDAPRALEIELAQLGGIGHQSVFRMSIRVARNHLLLPGNKTSSWSPSLVPPSLLTAPAHIIQRLVHMYFDKFHDVLPFVYKDAYMMHFYALKDPMQCPITMALCAYVCCGHYSGSNIDPIMPWFDDIKNRRAIAEYFYDHCRAVLDDIFDDPARRLETVMTINLLKRFLMNTLRISEMRKLESIAYMICMDLRAYYRNAIIEQLPASATASRAATAAFCNASPNDGQPPQRVSPMDAFLASVASIDPSRSSAPPQVPQMRVHDDRPRVSAIEHAVFARHYSFCAWSHVCLDFFNPDAPDIEGYHKHWEFIPLQPLPGESPVLAKYLHVQNLYFSLVLEPTVYTMFERVQNALLGRRVAFDLEIFLRFQSSVKAWWDNLPPEFRLCDDPNDMQMVERAIQECTDDVKLVLFVFYLDVISSCYICLVRAKSLTDMDHNLIHIIHNQSIRASLDAAEMMMLVIKSLDGHVAYSQFLSDVFLFVAVDMLAHLAQFDDPGVVQQARAKLARCFSALDAADFMAGHRVDSATSPLTKALLDSNATVFHLYNQYPHPRYALLYDMCRFLAPLDTNL
ncbi:hypothetical protein BC940DRAFT_371467 [Gongronella butleri]|nr:hypothetical protein BC940DRAFT_371467 [Gongronella butleri]